MNHQTTPVTSDPNTTDSFVMTAFFFEATLGAGALAIGWMIGIDPLVTVSISKDTISNHSMAVLWGAAATVPLLIALYLANQLRFRPLARIRGFVDAHIVPLFQPLSLFELGAISFAAGFGEEALFRGLLQAAIADGMGEPYGIFIGIAIASVLFGACHAITPTYALLAALAGAYFGLVFLWTGNLLAPLVAHALYDFLALVYLTRRSPGNQS